MEKKRSRVKSFIIAILSFIGVYLLGIIITFASLVLVSKAIENQKKIPLQGEHFKISDVVIKNELDDYSVENINSSVSDVIVQGNQSNIDRIYVIKPEIVLDEETIFESGIYKLDAKLRAYDSNDNLITGIDIVPNTIKVDVDILVRGKKLPIEVYTDGVPLAGKSVDKIKINGIDIADFRVMAYGDPEVLDEIEYIPVTINLDGSGDDSSSTFNVTLNYPTGITKLSETELVIEVDFGDSITKDITINNVTFTNLAEGLSANGLSDAFVVTIEGMPDVINKITAKDIKAFVDLKGCGVGEYDAEVYLSSDYYFVYDIHHITINISGNEKKEL